MELNYASNGKANAGLTTGIIGTALGALSALGASNVVSGSDDKVSKETFDVQMQLINAQTENAVLKSDLNTETKIVEAFKASVERENKIREELKTEIRELDKKVDSGFSAQAVINANVGSAVTLLQNQTSQLFGMTKLGIPNSSLCPGYGDVTITPTGCGTVAGTTLV